MLAQQGFHDVEFKLRREHNLQVAKILSDPEASENDKYVALQFLRNAETAVKGILPFCQDTGTAIIHGEKGQRVWTDFEDEESKASSAPEQPAVKLPKKTEKEKQKSDSQLPRKRYSTTARVLKSFGIDKSDLPDSDFPLLFQSSLSKSAFCQL